MPNYTNSVAPTSQATTVAGNSLVIPYGNISLITGVPHKYQLEVERVFSADKNGSSVYITQLLSDAAVSIENKRNVFIIPEADPSNTNTIYWTINEVTKEITIYTNPQTNQQNIGNRVFTANAYSIQVPPISNSNVVTIRRKTISNQPLVTWTPGNTLTSNQLNLETTQLLYLLQEVLDKVYRQISIGGDIVSQIADNSVSTSKIVDLNVTTGKLNNLSVTDAKLAADSVITSKILNQNVTTAKIADYNITPIKLSNISQTWSLTGTLALTNIDNTAGGTLVGNKNYVLGRVSRHGIITKDSSNVTSTQPNTTGDAGTNEVDDYVSNQSGGIWFNPMDGGLRVRVLDKWVRITGTPLTINDYISTGATAQTKTGNLTLGGTLDIAGNTTIGSTNPAGATLRYLDVYNTGATAVGPAGSILRLISTNVPNNGIATGQLIKYQTGSLVLQNTETHADGSILFWLGSSERMRIDSSGRVGIGTSNPSEKLEVSGNTTISGNATINGSISGSTVGALASSLLPSGCVLQVVEAVTTSSTDLSAATTWTSINGMSVTITPKRSTSKIIVIASFQSYLSATSSGSTWLSARVMRGTTQLSTHGVVHFVPGSQTNMLQPLVIDSESSPGTSPVTYSLQLLTSRNIGTTSIDNRYAPNVSHIGWADTTSYPPTPTPRHRIIAIEVAA